MNDTEKLFEIAVAAASRDRYQRRIERIQRILGILPDKRKLRRKKRPA